MRWRLALALLVSLAVPAAARTPAASPLPWIDDDYTKAVALAKARRLPIFVEAWAPW